MKPISKKSQRDARSFSCVSLVGGFTLVELIVTLVIIGALAAVGAPLFFGAQEFERSAFYNETLSSLRYARKLAIASGCAVSFSVAGNGYTIAQSPVAFAPMNPSGCNTPPFSATVVDPAGYGYPRTAANQTLTASVAAIVFCPRGDTTTAACVGNYLPQDATVTVTGSPPIGVTGTTGHIR